ncbi:M15 family metallopeptidase [Parafilimonas sp.]|uniref:M15 family metallopeptidase n=1 Tax=Parafilimonas sp. TaxID=1969739 RepID=UPI0039E57F16
MKYFFIAFIYLISFSAESCRVKPPQEAGSFKPTDLVELVKLDTSVHLDIRYATSNNFVGRPVYKEARAFLQRPAAEALVRVNAALKPLGYGLVVFDGYRPWHVTRLFWEVTPEDKKKFVANPKNGSRHNRGCAVDLSLYDLKTGKEIEMTGNYDEMTERSYPNYTGGTAEQRKMRDLLRSKMEAEGFTVYEYEWWHFDYKDWKEYPITNVPFSKIH